MPAVLAATGMQFQSTPPARGATGGAVRAVGHLPISIHAPREGGDGELASLGVQDLISIHAPREGGDYAHSLILPSLSDFNPRPPRGGRRISLSRRSTARNFNPRPPRGGRLRQVRRRRGEQSISIHAPREGGDRRTLESVRSSSRFQSTPPARGATAKMHSFTCGSLTNK